MRGPGARPSLALTVVASVTACGRIGFTTASGSDDAASRDGSGSGSGSDASGACAFDLCDGFEAPAIDTALWLVDPKATRDTTQAHRGAASVRFDTNALSIAQNGYTQIQETRTLAAPIATVWVRGWFMLPSLPATGNGMEISGLEQAGGGAGDYVFVTDTDLQVYSQFDNKQMGTGLGPPTDAWFCLIWKVTRATTATGGLELQGDTIPMVTLVNTMTDDTPPVADVQFGIGFASGNVVTVQPAFTLWLDDVIVHSGPVTCAD